MQDSNGEQTTCEADGDFHPGLFMTMPSGANKPFLGWGLGREQDLDCIDRSQAIIFSDHLFLSRGATLTGFAAVQTIKKPRAFRKKRNLRLLKNTQNSRVFRKGLKGRSLFAH